MSHKSFAAAVANKKKRPLTFDIAKGEKFTIERPLPGFALANLAAKGDSGGGEAVSAFIEFFEAVMDPEEFLRFKETANAERLDLETLIDIATYVIEEGSGRPT